jgi:hypothetical protein
VYVPKYATHGSNLSIKAGQRSPNDDYIPIGLTTHELPE